MILYNGDDRGDDYRLFDWKTLLAAFLIHVIVLVSIWGVTWLFSKPAETIIPIDMTVVVDENLDREPDKEKPVEQPKVEPEKPKPIPPKPPDPPPKLDEKQDAVIKEVVKPKPKVEPPKEPPKKVEPPKEPPKKVEPPKTEPKKPKVAPPNLKNMKHGAKVPVKPPANGPRTAKKLSDAEIRKALMAGARPGTTNQLTANEEQRCASLIRNAIRREWLKEHVQWYQGLREVPVEITLGPGGTIRGYRLNGTSGDANVDNSCRRALARVRQVVGLSAGFITQYSTVQVNMKLVD